MTVEPPKADPLDKPDGTVKPRPYNRLVAGLMEARDCSKGEAHKFILECGGQEAERVIRARWRGSRWSTGP